VLAADVWPGPEDSISGGYTRAGNKVFFYADDGEHDTELHALDLTKFGGWAAEPFGTGCGLTGEPRLTLEGEFRIGQAISLEIEDAAPLAPTGFYYALESTHVVVNGCNFYLLQPMPLIQEVTNGTGGLSLPIALPYDPRLVGGLVVMQAVPFVSGGPFLGIAEITNGLELLIGP
jgi:hypothetical protein